MKNDMLMCLFFVQDVYLSNNTYFSDSSHNETYTAANKLFQHFQNDKRHQNILDKNRRVKSASTLHSSKQRGYSGNQSRYSFLKTLMQNTKLKKNQILIFKLLKQLKYYRNANSQQNPSLGNNNNPTAQKMGDKIVSRNIYSGRNRNGIAVAKLNQTGGNIVDGKFVSHV